tara:strand:+ start:218 stop:655 length:438 start_codon:yes stop_codon:yes gene_type:complete
MFSQKNLCAFQKNAHPGKWRDRLASDWMKSTGLIDLGIEASSMPLSRASLKHLAALDSVTDRDVLWAILAWGGMRRDAARRLSKNENRWVEIVSALRRGGYDRRSSYEICATAVNTIKAGGIGPAYFTKLIFFANPRHDGYRARS